MLAAELSDKYYLGYIETILQLSAIIPRKSKSVQYRFASNHDSTLFGIGELDKENKKLKVGVLYDECRYIYSQRRIREQITN